MIVVRNSFIAKPGCASKLAKMLKEATAISKMSKPRVMTDVTGEFNSVVMEYEVESIGELEAQMKEYMTNEKLREKMVGYTDLWVTGKREVFQIV